MRLRCHALGGNARLTTALSRSLAQTTRIRIPNYRQPTLREPRAACIGDVLFCGGDDARTSRWHASSDCRPDCQFASLPSTTGTVHLEEDRLRNEGRVFFADGNVDVRYGAMRVQADHVQYNEVTYEVVARGHVAFDENSEHLTADQAEVNVKSGEGHFDNVHGELRVEHRVNPSVLMTPNPLSFSAKHVDRRDMSTYKILQTRMTVCDPKKPTWTFNASEATLHVDKTVALLNADFRILRIPLFYLPYADLPAGRRLRQSGFLVPQIARSSVRGEIIGDSYYWAPTDWADATVGAEWLSLRGSSQNGQIRMKPSEDIDFSARYFGVVDRLGEGGHQFDIKLNAQLADGWHAATDINELSSLVFQEVFSSSFVEAVNSEVDTTAFLTHHFSGFDLDFAVNSYKDFLSAQPQTAIVLQSAPQLRLDSQEQSPWKRVPLYFGFDSYEDFVNRSDPDIATRQYVSRSDFAPRVTLPLHWGPWLSFTPTYSLDLTRYGASEVGGIAVSTPVTRALGELSLDLRPPSLERVFQEGGTKWKHTITPELVYNYATGINDFAHFIRFDQDDTLTDTNEIEYSVTQRLFRKVGSQGSEEFASWTLLQKYYFDPTFGGALVPGVRNVFAALDSVTPFAFADGPRRFSPVVSDFKVTPGGRYDAEWRIDYDPVRGRITSSESLLKMRPYGDLNVTLAHYDIHANPVLQPFSNQVRAIIGYRETNQRGWNASAGFSYDLRQGVAQNELAQVSYNSSCCGLAFGYQRLALGSVRNENEFRLSFVIANLGTFGNIRRQDKLF